MQRTHLVAALVLTVATGIASGSPAQAGSATAVAENSAQECVIYPVEEDIVENQQAPGVYELVLKDGRYQCEPTVSAGVGDQGSRVVVGGAGAAAYTALGAPDSIDAAVQAVAVVAGQLVAQVEDLTGLHWAVSVASSGPGGIPTVTPTVGGGGRSATTTSSGSDSYSKFKWIHHHPEYWDPDTNGQGALDGRANVNLYKATEQIHPAWRFLATSQAASVTPVNGHRITKLLGSLTPNSNTEPVEASPISVNKYGSGGSMSLGARLSGEGGGGAYGGEFSIGRTWNFAEGTVGGGLLSSGEHYTQWQAGNKAGSTTAKAAEGVETWKIPADGAAGWNYQGVAWYRK